MKDSNNKSELEDIKIKRGKLAVCSKKLINAGFTKVQAEIMCAAIAIRDEEDETEIVDTIDPQKMAKKVTKITGLSMGKFTSLIRIIKSKKGQKVGAAGILPFKIELPMKNLNRLQTKFEKLITSEQEWLTAEEFQKRSQYAQQMKKTDSIKLTDEEFIKELEENVKSIITDNSELSSDEIEEKIFDYIIPNNKKIWVDSSTVVGKANFGMNNIIKAPITLAREMVQTYRLRNRDGTYRTEKHFKPYSELKKAVEGVEKVYMIIEHRDSWVVMDTVGCVRDLYADDKTRSIRGMGYFVESKLPAVVLNALKNEEPFGVSIGFMAELGPAGTFKGIHYDYTQMEMILDHLAICIDSIPRCPTDQCGINVGEKITVDSTKFTIIKKDDYYYNINDILYKSEKIKKMTTDGFKDPKTGQVAGDEPDIFVEMLGKLRKYLAGINDTDKTSSMEDQMLKIFGEKKNMKEEEFKDALLKKDSEIGVLSDMLKEMKIKEILGVSKLYTDAQLKEKSLMELKVISELASEFNPSDKKPAVIPITGKDADKIKDEEDKKYERIDPRAIFADVSKNFMLDAFLAENFGDKD